MSNENSNKKSGPDGTFKVRLKKPTQDDTYTYLKSDNNGNLTWGSTWTLFNKNDADPNNPSKWTFTTGGTSKYLKKVAQPGADDKVEWSGDSGDSGWAFSAGKLSYTGASGTKYLQHNGDGNSPTLVTNSTTEIEIV